MVPRLLSPTHRNTSVEQKWDDTKISQQLLQPLNAFIAGTEAHQEVFKVKI
jgi:hypothetical protein